ncbi:hypothetical protein [Caulobacter sp. 17J80-11]|uniref:hypothetical protein n=1 Tax=Caulobacter sp. 17J80-11 TaxID=2763502 RepID=UPI0016538DE6|nr:hypothetical protein [Caulobacter sp. 17J80-11]MBC6982870.1 hypothetical protein [Caulobacter sp. 17J80-11]
MPREVHWVARHDGDAVVWVDMAKFEQAWSGVAAQYVGKGGRGPTSDSFSKYRKFGQWFAATARPVEMAEVFLNGGFPEFSNGRHRVAWLRDHGLRAFPLATNPDLAAEFTERFGTAIRSSVLL